MTTYEIITDMIRTIALIGIAVYLIVTINFCPDCLVNRLVVTKIVRKEVKDE